MRRTPEEGVEMRKSVRTVVMGLLVAAGLALAPAAFARSHWNVGIGIGLPGISIGYSDCHHCGRGWGGNYYYGGYYSSYYAPVYYGPTYYGPSYYDTAYYGPAYYYPRYYGVRYYDRPSHGYHGHGYRGHGYRDGGHHGRDYGHRATYYDRSGYYRH
ncbi:hypothetical protein [Dokdonella fugitiva]|jgi:hypothetical protein|uniref:hypothetical protein n=1 Tax=Dokdonella fugitiva TaxID=328517 RepID=UPI00184F4B12|nr:hypothetical protein [Dokdonella fugitiva]MBA8883150.1 hypothetical protein [Dokdonella fugitiva]